MSSHFPFHLLKIMLRNEKKLYTVGHHLITTSVLGFSSLAVCFGLYILAPQYELPDLLSAFICTLLISWGLGAYEVIFNYLEKINQTHFEELDEIG